MAAPTTILATGTYYTSAGVLAAGTVTFNPVARSTPSSDVVPGTIITATVTAGALSQALVSGVAYNVTENIVGPTGAITNTSFQIPGTANVDLSTVSITTPTTAFYQNGTGILLVSTSAITVTHHCPTTPTWVDCSPTGPIIAATQIYVSAITSTTFTLTSANAAGTATSVTTAVPFMWEAHL